MPDHAECLQRGRPPVSFLRFKRPPQGLFEFQRPPQNSVISPKRWYTPSQEFWDLGAKEHRLCQPIFAHVELGENHEREGLSIPLIDTRLHCPRGESSQQDKGPRGCPGIRGWWARNGLKTASVR
jgi:hypothetical protein